MIPARARAADKDPAAPPHTIAYLFPITFCSGIVFISLGPTLDPIIRDLGVSLSQGGILATGYAAGRVVALLVLNLFLARVPLKWLVVGEALLQAVGFAGRLPCPRHLERPHGGVHSGDGCGSLVTLVVIISGAVFAHAAGPIGEALGMRTAIGLAAVPALLVVLLSFLLPRASCYGGRRASRLGETHTLHTGTQTQKRPADSTKDPSDI